MWVFWVLSLLPILIWLVIWALDEKIVLWEAAISCSVALAMAAIFQYSAVIGMTRDTETWSGQIDHATHHPRWVEEYQEMHTRTVGSGKDEHTEIYYTTEHRTHPEHWTAETSIDTTYGIEQSFFEEIRRNFKNLTTETPGKSGFYSGDRNIYVAYNKTGFCYPVTDTRTWQNRIKAAPSVFSFTPVPKTLKVYDWPKNPDWQVSDRLLGSSSVLVNKLEFDRMNARLGPMKKVNVIMVGFFREPAIYGQYQQAAWVGGKKNDLVICFGGATRNEPPQWVYVFGWTDKELVKQNLQTLLLNNVISTDLLPEIEAEIRKNYVIKDWSKFDYIKIEPPNWSYVIYFVVLCLTHFLLFFCLEQNSYVKYGMDFGGRGLDFFSARFGSLQEYIRELNSARRR